MKTRGLAYVLFIVSALAGCASDPCGRTSPCPNDTPSTQAQRDQCRATLSAYQNSPCYNEALAYTNCQLDNRVCGGDGRTDPALSETRANTNCTNQKADALACCTRNPTSSVCAP